MTPGRHRRHAALAAGLATLTAVLLPGPAAAQLAPPPAPLLEGPPAGVAWPDAPEVASPVFLLLDADTGQVLAARDADDRRPVASTIKILTALSVADRLEFDEVVEAGPEVDDTVGASVDLEPGERWTVEQLLQAILVRSGNDAADALAAAVGGSLEGFVALMHEDAEAVGIPVTAPDGPNITSPTGLDDEQELSAEDLATLARVLLDDPDLRRIVAAPEATLPGVGTDENRNLLVGSYPGATGVKTGFTEAAGNSVVGSARRDGRELIAVVLGAGLDPERFVDATVLLDHGFGAFAAAELGGERTLLVAGGTRILRLEEAAITAPTGTEVVADLPTPVRAPDTGEVAVPVLFDGVRVATATATVGGDEPAPAEGGASLGRALTDGTYAALRAAHGAGRLP